MASNYEAISRENRRRYGTDIGRIGPMLLADRYDDRTHFIFELIQNAEDALNRRGDCAVPRHINFTLEPGRLTLSHFGKPFDEADVRGICGIAESTKDQLSIGRFGIGFKSVYTFTDRPEIHSGEEDFAIESYVLPVCAAPKARQPDETLIILPLKEDDHTAEQEIIDGFKRLGPSALLFLRQIEEIKWSVRQGDSGFYQRSTPEWLGPNVRRITVIGQETGGSEVDQTWLVFHRDVFSDDQERVGKVEVAFMLEPNKDKTGAWTIVPVPSSPLVVFFPTAVETSLGFLIQGPYKTTPSRDNIPRHEPWNKFLVKQTAGLLVEAMRWLRDNNLLDISALRCLPLDRNKFFEGSMFEPFFTAVHQALTEEPLLPRFGGGYVPASQAKLARTQELRELFSPSQVAQLFESEEASWLTGDITQDRAPEIRQYVMRELGVTEVTPDSIIPRLNQSFLEAQSDEWIALLYKYLSRQPALRRRLNTVPLIRLDDGRHVVAQINGEPQAFLPSNIETEFPTISQAVCSSPEARSFLTSLGITEPDLIDDVVHNVLQKYRRDSPNVDDDQYAKDINRILTAFNTDSKAQREKLLAALRETDFVKVIDASDGSRHLDKPSNIYLATDRLKQLFDGVASVMIVDDSQDCLRGENIRELLEACGAVRFLRPIKSPDALSHAERHELRQKAGHEETSGLNDQVIDWTLKGLNGLLELLPTLTAKQRIERARLLWESLGDLEERRGRRIFDGSYKWTHYGSYKMEFPSAFIRLLNEAAWVPDANGELHPPALVIFDNLDWKPSPFLLTKIKFKPPVIEQLAKEIGIEPAALDLLRKHGITSVDELKSRLGISDPPSEETQSNDARSPSSPGVYVANDINNDTPTILPGRLDPESGDPGRRTGAGIGGGRHGGQEAIPPGGDGETRRPTNTKLGGSAKDYRKPGKRSPSSCNGGRPFISYVGVHLNDEETDPDGLDQAQRMQIEQEAIAKILQLEPLLKRTPEGNPGYDLYELDSNGKPARWIEVKSMTGSLQDHPVGLSYKQFELARDKGAAYWLYIVEYATDPQRARVVRIQDPAGKARTFTFDHGWTQVAEVTPIK